MSLFLLIHKEVSEIALLPCGEGTMPGRRGSSFSKSTFGEDDLFFCLQKTVIIRILYITFKVGR